MLRQATILLVLFSCAYPVYAAIEVPEFWRYDGQVLSIYLLQAGRYQEVETSSTFPEIAKDWLYQFLQDCNELGETAAKRQLRDRLIRAGA